MQVDSMTQRCLAKPDRIRGWACILFPFIAMAIYLYMAFYHDVSLNIYINALNYDLLFLLRQLAGIIGICVWIWKIWPQAILAIRNFECAISYSEGYITFYENVIAINDIELIKRDSGFLKRNIVIILKNGQTAIFPAVLVSRDFDSLFQDVSNIVQIESKLR